MEWIGGCSLIINSPDNTTEAFPIHLLFFVTKDAEFRKTATCFTDMWCFDNLQHFLNNPLH